jgi:DNA-directed RNA polymerase sigma subunit (sigma70/sigma32)
LREIGGSLNLTEGRISQILHQALAKLKEMLSGDLELSGGP